MYAGNVLFISEAPNIFNYLNDFNYNFCVSIIIIIQIKYIIFGTSHIFFNFFGSLGHCEPYNQEV